MKIEELRSILKEKGYVYTKSALGRDSWMYSSDDELEKFFMILLEMDEIGTVIKYSYLYRTKQGKVKQIRDSDLIKTVSLKKYRKCDLIRLCNSQRKLYTLYEKQKKEQKIKDKLKNIAVDFK